MKTQMKIRLIAALLCLPMLAGVLMGCASDSESPDETRDQTQSKETDGQPETKVLSVENIASELSTVEFVMEMQKASDSVVSAKYGFTKGSVSVIVYGGSGATPEEIIVAQYESEDKAKDALTKYETRLENQKTRFDSYNAQYRYLLDDAIVEQFGAYIVYCVCEDADAALDIVNAYKAL